MPMYKVWTNATKEEMIQADSPVDAVSEYHRKSGTMPDNWDGMIHVRDEEGGERTFSHRKAA